MVSCSIVKNVALQRKLNDLKTLTNSKSVKRSAIIKDATLHIYKLKLKCEAMKRHYLHLMNHFQDQVKVERHGRGFLVSVMSVKGDQQVMLSVLEALEEMGLEVLQARVSCRGIFKIEAIVEPQVLKVIDVSEVKLALQKAINFDVRGHNEGSSKFQHG